MFLQLCFPPERCSPALYPILQEHGALFKIPAELSFLSYLNSGNGATNVSDQTRGHFENEEA